MIILKRVMVVFIAIFVLAGTFAGCSGKDSGKDTVSKPTMVTGDTDTNAATTSSDENTGATQENTEAEVTFPASLKAGDVITFGKYAKNAAAPDAKEPIEWQILTVENGKALLLSKKILDTREYHEEEADVTWETCSLRAWLNNEFYNGAFSAGERAKISTTRVLNGNHPKPGVSGGNDTDDRVFLLSLGEVTNPDYGFNASEKTKDPARLAQATDYAKNKGLIMNPNGNGVWWLRTPGNLQFYAFTVLHDGFVPHDYLITFRYLGVRPALWVNL